MDEVTATLIVVGLCLLGFALYFLPTIVAAHRDHPSANAIFALNFLAGWTFVGWLIALVWALASIQAAVAPEAVSAGDTRPCPFCAETIRAAAIKCKHCGSDLITDPRSFVQ